ncbi:MAG: hypothetical protein KF767_03015 [Bdellovibrionaceae bacterium]|nr:hypothetical protein [Pseudobdellovibrionaceae bacterium]
MIFLLRVLFLLSLSTPSFAQATDGCSVIPGCKKLYEAKHEPFVASITVLTDYSGQVRHLLNVNYFENESSTLRFCAGSNVRDLDLIIVTGPPEKPTTFRRAMLLSCPRDFGAHPVLRNSARWTVEMEEHPELWDLLFPLDVEGVRRLKLQVAVVNSRGQWDSRYGLNYPLEFVERP